MLTGLSLFCTPCVIYTHEQVHSAIRRNDYIHVYAVATVHVPRVLAYTNPLAVRTEGKGTEQLLFVLTHFYMEAL